ncbi:hypothetical protein NDU88_006503 [Pleurodeles waltl]|uniref:Uncharacterized protein n=1 Tax=Pleurodeles waltl TaxID=8319 RepID=A0AAV7WXS2_PLEWA|nr:hypothetical protein NDU88_006503 [Pleurodeles waltl]
MRSIDRSHDLVVAETHRFLHPPRNLSGPRGPVPLESAAPPITPIGIMPAYHDYSLVFLTKLQKGVFMRKMWRKLLCGTEDYKHNICESGVYICVNARVGGHLEIMTTLRNGQKTNRLDYECFGI